jgi:hypothetical protein
VKEIKALAASGMLGSGFKEESLRKGLSWGPDFIGCDAGSTDSGPYYLGSGKMHFSRDALRRDLRLILLGAISSGIPAIIGSAGTGGADSHLQQVVHIVRELAGTEGLHFRLGVIHSEIQKNTLIDFLRKGRCKPLRTAPPLSEETIRGSQRIVGVAGVEPFVECLDNGCGVIIAGRSSDTSIFAALPLKQGFPPGPVWHSAKILECGAACVAQRRYPDCMFSIIDENGFSVEPPNPEYCCTPVSVASHMLYENASAYELIEPSGVLVSAGATYKAVDSRRVRVEGSRFKPAQTYTVKLEGAAFVGHKCVIIGGVRDPVILRQLDSWLEGMRQKICERFQSIYGDEINDKYQLLFRVYGRDAVMGELEPNPVVGHEVGVVIEIVADTEDLTRSLASAAGHIAVHYPVPEWSGLITGLAYPNSPAEMYVGPVYEFSMNHIVEPESYRDIFSIEYEEI